MSLFSETYAQHMDLEGGNFDCLDEEKGWFKSLIPCDGLIVTPDETYAECSWCHERFSTNEIWDHEYVCPERERQSQNPWANDDGGNSSGGGGYSGGNGNYNPNGSTSTSNTSNFTNLENKFYQSIDDGSAKYFWLTGNSIQYVNAATFVTGFQATHMSAIVEVIKNSGKVPKMMSNFSTCFGAATAASSTIVAIIGLTDGEQTAADWVGLSGAILGDISAASFMYPPVSIGCGVASVVVSFVAICIDN